MDLSVTNQIAVLLQAFSNYSYCYNSNYKYYTLEPYIWEQIV